MQHNDQSWEEDSINQFQIDFEGQNLSEYFMKDDASSPNVYMSTPIKQDNQFVQYNQIGSTIHLHLVESSAKRKPGKVIFIIDPTKV